MADQGSNRRDRALKAILYGLAAIAAVTLFDAHYPAAMSRADLLLGDLRIYHREPPAPTGLVVIAAVDDKSIAELGRWPWPRGVMARLVDALGADKVAVVGFDVMFSERDSADVARERIAARLTRAGVSAETIGKTLGPSNDEALARAIAAQGSTYLDYGFSSHLLKREVGTDLSAYQTAFLKPPPLAYGFVRKGPGAIAETIVASAYLAPLPEFNAAARAVAFADIDEDADGKARAYPAVIRFNGRYCVPLFLAVAAAYMGHPPLSLEFADYGVARVALGDLEVPVDEMGEMMVHFRGPARTIANFSIADIIAGRIAPATLAGKIVIVGVTAHALGDRLATPMGGDFPGVEMQANAIDNVLRGDFIHRSLQRLSGDKWLGWAMGLAVGVAATFMTAVASAAVVVMLALGYLLYAAWRLSFDGAVVGVVFPLATLIFTYGVMVSYHYITEGREKRYLRHAFEHYLNPDVIAAVVDKAGGLKLGGERRHLSILFADIVGFTTRSERSEPEPLVALLNTYMTAMTDLILESGGVVDKLMGDGIMAFWGAPLPNENPARAAVDCALKMLAELKALRARDDRFTDVNIGIGIATGPAIVGNFGGERRFDYSVIGDTVNLASRVEGLTRQFKVTLLVNGPTWEEAGAGFVGREIGLVRVKGKEQLTPLVEVVGRESEDGADAVYYRRFAAAIEELHRGESPQAALTALLNERPGDRVAAMCLERLAATAGQQLREMVFEFDTK